MLYTYTHTSRICTIDFIFSYKDKRNVKIEERKELWIINSWELNVENNIYIYNM